MLFLEISIHLIIFNTKSHKLYAYVIYDLWWSIYLSTVKGDSKSPKGSLNESSFLTRGESFNLEGHYSSPNAFSETVVSQWNKATWQSSHKPSTDIYRRTSTGGSSTWKRPQEHLTFEIQLKVHPSICKGLELPKQLSGLYWELRRRSSSGSWNSTVIILFALQHTLCFSCCSQLEEKEQLSVIKGPRGY